uniref:Uncharacterized protein n=1 Tax=Plectus sambesii TaxID=2011161 RepID=A0A914XIE9_9BILA
MAATYDADSWMKENTARRATRRSKQHKETGFIRRVSDDQFPHTAALKATNGLNVPTEEKDPFDLPTPLMIYSLNKKGRWNCVQRLRSIDDMQSPSVQVTALEKYLQAGSPPTPTALDDKKMTAALRVVDEHVVALADDRNPTPPRSTEQQLVRSTSVDSLSDTRQQVSYEVALLHPSAALWTKHAKGQPVNPLSRDRGGVTGREGAEYA